MHKILVFIAFFFGGLLATATFTSCEKTEIEQTNVQTFDANQWNALLIRLDNIENNQNDFGATLATMLQMLSALQADVANIQNGQTLLQNSVNDLAVALAGQGTLLSQILPILQNGQVSWALSLQILQAVQTQLQALATQTGADLATIKAQLLQVIAAQTQLAAQNAQLLTWAQQNSADIQQLITLFNGVQPTLQAILNGVNGIQLSQQQQGLLLATLIANDQNHTLLLQQVLSSVNGMSADLATQTAIINSLLNGLNALGQDISSLSTTLVNGIAQLQLGQANQNLILGQLLTSSNNQTATLNVILSKLDDLAASQADQQALLATLIANSTNQLAASNQILNALTSQGLTQAQMMGMLNGITNQLSNLQGSLDTWGSTIVAGIDNLGLTLAQQGTVLGQILANTQNLTALNVQIINKLDDIIADVADLKVFIGAEIASVKAEIATVQISLAALTAKTEAIALQIATFQATTATNFALVISMLDDLDDNLCCNSCNGGNAPSITNVWNNVYQDMSTNIVNHTVDNSTNLTFQQYYYAAQNGVGVAQNGGFGGMNGCQVMAPVVILANNGGTNNIASNNQNWSGVQQNVVDFDNTNNCPWNP